MNKKIMVMAISILTLVMLTTPFIGTAQACRSICKHSSTFDATFELRNPNTTPYPGGFTPPISTKYFGPIDSAYVTLGNPEGHKYALMKGYVIWGTVDCGPLGLGKLTITQNYWRHNYETDSGILSTIYYLEFDGNYGDYVGTLTGRFLGKITEELQIPVLI